MYIYIYSCIYIYICYKILYIYIIRKYSKCIYIPAASHMQHSLSPHPAPPRIPRVERCPDAEGKLPWPQRHRWPQDTRFHSHGGTPNSWMV